MKRGSCHALAAILLAAASLQASVTDELIEKLRSGDARGQADARHMLTHQGVEAVEAIVPLVASDDGNVWPAAFNVLADFANEASAPGREADRRVVAAQVYRLIQADQPDPIKVRGLRLVPIVTPKGYDVGPVAALLRGSNADLQEKARAALQDMRTPEGAKALRDYLPTARPEFACAILDSLGFLQDADSLDAIRAMTKHGSPAVRASAARALAWTGDPANTPIVDKVVESADEATRPAAMDAKVRLIERIAEKGGNWQFAVDTWLSLLQHTDGVVRQAALAGLGRWGDGSCVQPILTAIAHADPDTQRIGLSALVAMQGRDVARAIVAVYAATPFPMRPGLVRALGTKKDGLALPIFEESIISDDAALRAEAIEAIAASGLPQGVAMLAQAAESPDAAVRTAAIQGLLSLAEALREENQKAEAARAYAAVLRRSKDTDARRRAMIGAAACPSPEAYDAILQAADDPDLADVAVNALLAAGQAMTAAKQKEKAVAAFDRLRAMRPPLAVMTAVVKCLHDLGIETDVASQLGFMRKWHVLGPFELGEQNKGWNEDFIGEPKVDLAAGAKVGDRTLAWKPVTTDDPMGKVDLRKAIADRDNAIGYAYAEITVEQDMDAVLRIGADDSEKVWVNGQKVFEHFVARGLTIDDDRIPVKLKAGTNTILMKIWQNAMGWEFCARITAPDDRPIAFTQK